MEFGIQLPTWGVTEFSAPLCLDLSRMAEETGFHSVWVGDHLIESPQLRELGGDGQLDALTLLGAIAATTRRVWVGSCVVIPVRSPIHTWVAFATLGHISPGRIIAGLGVGGFEPEFQVLGLDFARRGDILDEVVALFREWPSAEALHPALNGWSTPVRPDPMPSIWLGSSLTAGRSLARIVKYASGWFPTYPTVGEYQQANHRLDEALEEAGRDPALVTRSALFRCCIAEDRKEALVRSERFLAPHDRVLDRLLESNPGAKLPRPARVSETTDHDNQHHLVGDPELVIDRLSEYRDAGMEHAVVTFIPAIESFESLELFAREVMPVFRNMEVEQK